MAGQLFADHFLELEVFQFQGVDLLDDVVHHITLVVRTRQEVVAWVIFQRFLHLGATPPIPEALPALVHCALPHHVLSAEERLAASQIFESLERSSVEVLLRDAPLALLAGLAEAAEVIVH